MEDPKATGVFLIGLLIGVAVSNSMLSHKGVEQIRDSIDDVLKLFDKIA